MTLKSNISSNKYDDYSKEDLIKLIKVLKLRKKYGLVWDDEINKEISNTELNNKIPVLDEITNKNIIDIDKPTNILIEGDNYDALSILNYTHEKKNRCDLYRSTI